MGGLIEFKTCADDFEVEFEALPLCAVKSSNNERQRDIVENISEIDIDLQNVEDEVAKLNTDIDRLTNRADSMDYTMAVFSGILCGLIDSIVVGAWDFESAKAQSNKNINEKVMEFAKKNGFGGDRLDSAIKFLEDKYKLPGDGEWKGLKIHVSATSHHLDDFCHHPTIVGLICNVLVQFTGSATYVNKFRDVKSTPVMVNEYGKFVGNNPVTKFFAGTINWFFQIAKTMANAKGHWMSDMAGSSKTAGGGMGLPGSFMSLMKVLSALPIFKDSNFSLKLHRAYTEGIGEGAVQVDLGAFNALFEGASSKLDMRTEGAIKLELKRQAMPVVVNEVLVRGFYFIRQFIEEFKEVRSLRELRWKNVIPFNNRTITRMITIASGTFVAVDMADAAIRSAVKNGAPSNPKFWSDFVLRVNIVGVGRFAIAVGVDVGSGVKKGILENRRMKLNSQILVLQNAKLFYLNEGMWIEADNLSAGMEELEIQAEKNVIFYQEAYKEIFTNIDGINDAANKIDNVNPDFSKRFRDKLFWGAN